MNAAEALQPSNTPWSRHYRLRQRVQETYPNVWTIPLCKKGMNRLLANIQDGDRVLEVGAGDRRFYSALKALRPNIQYRSMDIDRHTHQDYYQLDEIKGEYDVIYAFELIEHITPEEGLFLLQALRDHLRVDGTLILSTPNLYHPHRYFEDITHKTPYTYQELGAMLLMAGYQHLRCFRLFNDAWLQRVFRLYIGVWLHRFLDIDFAGTILYEGTKGDANAAC